MNSYVVGKSTEELKEFFSVLPDEKRPKIVSDKEFPGIWDHPSDDPVIISTADPRVDTDAKEITIDGKQVDEVMEQLAPPADIKSDDPLIDPEPAPEEPEPVKGPMTYRDRGFKVGRLL